MAGAILASAALRHVHDEPRHSGNESEIESPEAKAPQQETPPGPPEIESWDSGGVAMWLESRGLPQDVVRAAREADVDGATLLELTHDGWAELGLASKVAQAKIRAAVRRVNHHHEGAPHAAAGAGEGGTTRNSGTNRNSGTTRNSGTASGSEYPKSTEDLVYPLICKRTPIRGAEHASNWVPAIANASAEPARAKEHVMRFLGMYNVVDLLSFTIAASYLFSQGAATSWWSIMLQYMAITSGWMTGVGLWLSTIMYNCSSAVSDANFTLFLKIKSTSAGLKNTDDFSLWGFIGLLIMMMSHCIQLGLGEVLPLKVDTTQDLSSGSAEYVVFVIARILLVSLPGEIGGRPKEYVWRGVLWSYFIFDFAERPWKVGQLKGVGIMTHAVLYGGLMGDAEMLPPGESAGWAISASLEEVEEYICGLIESRLSHGTFEEDILQRYASQSREAVQTQSVPVASATPLASEPGVGSYGRQSRRDIGGFLQLR